MKNIFLTLAFLHFAFFAFSQELVFGIIPINQTIKKGAIQEVKVINDINPRFPADWVKQYVAVNLSVSCNGEMVSVAGIDDRFNEEQLRILRAGDTGGQIDLDIMYYPNNDLSKEIKNFNFSYAIAPDLDANFPTGKEALKKYLSEKAVEPLAEMPNSDIHQVKISFTITEDGAVSQAKILQRSHLEKVDEHLLNSMSNMPHWIPARNADGTNVSQDFEFIVSRDLCYYGNLFAEN